MSNGIFLIQDDDSLVEMREQPYGSESLLQGLLARYPNLLAGDQMDADVPRRWLLVSREMGVPDAEDGNDRWSLDHLFLDQDAIPTLVEVKRSSDTRIRREVVGQMLDYAANAVSYLPVESIRASFENQIDDDSPAKRLDEFLGQGTDVEAFWLQVKTNLQAGRIRLVFVADEIPSQLRRIVEFLNEQMDPAEVLAVEIKQFVGSNLRTLVPRVIGQTNEAERKKGKVGRIERQWDEASFFEDLSRRRGEAEVFAAREILNWARKAGMREWWGKGAKMGSFFPVLEVNGQSNYIIGIWSSGSVELQFQHMRRNPFADEAKRTELRRKLTDIPGLSIPVEKLDKRPSFPLGLLVDRANMSKFLDVLNWYVAQVTSLS